MLKDREIELMQPWSPMLMRTRMLDSEVQAFLEITDKIINNVNSESWGHKLAGQIKTELKIEHQDLMQETIEGISAFDVILEYVKEYISKAVFQYATSQRWPYFSKQTWKTVLNSCWIVSQQPGEYNPMHVHTECNISGVFYLKVPEFEKSIKSTDDDGCIVFLGGSTAGTETHLVNNRVTWKPRVGDLFVFPSHLAHAVYPYTCNTGDPERRSVSFNADFMTESVFKRKFGK